jgi:hypothetical protein
MHDGILHAKRISHNLCEVFIERGDERSLIQAVKTTELLIAAARHSLAASFDAFFPALATVGSYASLPAVATDDIAADLGLRFA